MGYPWKPPYTRMPGGLVIATPDSEVVLPSFFPAPTVWAALFADALGARFAGGFAALFGALAAVGLLALRTPAARSRAAVLATTLVALNAAAIGPAASRFRNRSPGLSCGRASSRSTRTRKTDSPPMLGSRACSWEARASDGSSICPSSSLRWPCGRCCAATCPRGRSRRALLCASRRWRSSRSRRS
jgi:hypothetical protein